MRGADGASGNSAGVREIEQLLNAGLLLANARGELQPQLAEAAPTLENGLWKLLPDGWTVVTADGSLSAQFEHTIAITEHGPEILSQL